MPPREPRAGTCPMRRAGTGRNWWSPTAGSVRRKPVTPAGMSNDIGWDEHWQCGGCSVIHQRDDNAAVNLARYEETVPRAGRSRHGSAERQVDDLLLLDRVHLRRARRRRRHRPSRDPLESGQLVGQQLWQLETETRPRALVGRFLLNPEVLLH